MKNEISQPYFKVECADVSQPLISLPDNFIQCCITSPPYYALRDYGVGGQIGVENTPEEYISKIVKVFREVRRTLRDDGTLWLNIGDSYAGSGKGAWENKNGGQKEVYTPDRNSPQCKIQKVPNGLKPKDLIGIPWRVAFALQADGWYLRQDIIWHKPNAMPESVKDRCTKAHEYLFLLTKSRRYYFDNEAIKEPSKNQSNGSTKISVSKTEPESRNRRSVWSVPTKPFKGAHFAVFPQALIEPCILAGCPEGGIVLDPFMGSGTAGVVAVKNKRNFIGYDINHTYVDMAHKRITEAYKEQLTIVTG